VPVFRGSITLFDTAVLMSFYAVYVVASARGEQEEDEHEHDLVGPGRDHRRVDEDAPPASGPRDLRLRRGHHLHLGRALRRVTRRDRQALRIDEFLLVQWLAPLASESPEFVVASILVARGAMSKGMRTLVSSGVNQWTVLVGTLPVVMSISAGTPSALPLDARQTEEVLLTAAQGLFGVAVIADRTLTRWQGALLAALFFGQFFVPSTHGRQIFAVAYLIAAVAVYVGNADARTGMVQSFRVLWAAVRGRPVP
jgi:cation:H+ antiporter